MKKTKDIKKKGGFFGLGAKAPEAEVQEEGMQHCNLLLYLLRGTALQ